MNMTNKELYLLSKRELILLLKENERVINSLFRLIDEDKQRIEERDKIINDLIKSNK